MLSKRSLIFILLAIAIALSLFSFFEFYDSKDEYFGKGESESSAGKGNIIIEILPPENYKIGAGNEIG